MYKGAHVNARRCVHLGLIDKDAAAPTRARESCDLRGIIFDASRWPQADDRLSGIFPLHFRHVMPSLNRRREPGPKPPLLGYQQFYRRPTVYRDRGGKKLSIQIVVNNCRLCRENCARREGGFILDGEKFSGRVEQKVFLGHEDCLWSSRALKKSGKRYI